MRGSLFCQTRETAARPLCGFYAAAASRVLQLLGVPGEARLESCRAAGGGQGCVMSIQVEEPASEEAPEPADLREETGEGAGAS